MCKYCDEGSVLRSSEVEFLKGQKCTLALIMARSKVGDPIIRAKALPNTKDPNSHYGDVYKTYTCAIKIKYCPFCGVKLVEDPIFPELASESAKEICRNPANGPAILFWDKDEDIYWGVDNRDHNAFALSFKTKEECLEWLSRRNDL